MAGSESGPGWPKILTLGEPLIEFNQTDPAQPLFLQGFGGDTSNTAIAAARQGASVGYLTRLGADSFGDLFVDLWAREGVDTRGVLRDAAAHTAVYFVSHGPQGHAFSYLRAGSAASRITPSDLPHELLANCRWLHVSGISQAISASACDTVFAAIDAVHECGGKVSFDSNLRLKLWPLDRARAVIRATIPLADIFLPSIEDMQQLSGLTAADEILDWCFAAGARIVVLKLGRDGALYGTPEERHHVAGHRVDAVDATGAGDCFGGSLLARIVAGDSLAQAVTYANAAAALTTLGFGAVAPIPRTAEVKAFLELTAQGTRK
jgi:2-dehydro-3-deoxygluconokinase